MPVNLTRELKLVEEIPSKGWFANPTGQEGYRIIVLQHRGNGGKFVRANLGPGQNMDWRERVGIRYTILRVDTRDDLHFPIEGEFRTRDRIYKVAFKAKVYYEVTDAKIVATKKSDPLGMLHSKIISTLNDKLWEYSEAAIRPNLITQIICNVSASASASELQDLGLRVKDAAIIEFNPDEGVSGHILTEAQRKYDIRVKREEWSVEEDQLAHELRMQDEQRKRDLQERRDKIDLERYEDGVLPLTNFTTLARKYPELAAKIFDTFATRDREKLQARLNIIKPTLEGYIAQQKAIEAPIEPDVILQLMASATTSSESGVENLITSGSLTWGDDMPEAIPSTSSYTDASVSESKQTKEGSSDEEATDEPPLIEWGD